ncbi:DUF3011 domain-containing protein [Glacieibacterium frigidum]|uniref:DUF3011 domain-containing protein n=1 Tax=Glacieibacterium frigidum TaxID=2593303 RepID=A0A552UGU0_9SPHN|nr:DUF3011 domain-containing protein [Glacieibacterium frigidum]TRW17453.1 DUF3011 domain-containing protein [Glacieibacterium frigidum]
MTRLIAGAVVVALVTAQGAVAQDGRYYQGGGGNYGGASQVRCESFNYRYKRCPIDTRGGVSISRRIAGDCNSRNWGHDRRSIWVDNGCRAIFSTGYNNGNDNDGKGPSTGAVIAGVAVAGGLIALLAGNAANKKKKKEREAAAAAADAGPVIHPPQPPAALVANLDAVPSGARSSVQTCLFEAARQIGATGGTRLAYDVAQSLEPGNGGWRLRAAVRATYPDGVRDVPMYCRATPSKVIELTFG